MVKVGLQSRVTLCILLNALGIMIGLWLCANRTCGRQDSQLNTTSKITGTVVDLSRGINNTSISISCSPRLIETLKEQLMRSPVDIEIFRSFSRSNGIPKVDDPCAWVRFCIVSNRLFNKMVICSSTSAHRKKNVPTHLEHECMKDTPTTA